MCIYIHTGAYSPGFLPVLSASDYRQQKDQGFMALLMTKDPYVNFVVGLLLRASWQSASVHGAGTARDKNGACERRLPQLAK